MNPKDLTLSNLPKRDEVQKRRRRSVDAESFDLVVSIRGKNIRDMQLSADLLSVRLEMKINELDLAGQRVRRRCQFEEQRCAADEALDPKIEHSSLCVCGYRSVLRTVTVVCERRKLKPSRRTGSLLKYRGVIDRAIGRSDASHAEELQTSCSYPAQLQA